MAGRCLGCENVDVIYAIFMQLVLLTLAASWRRYLLLK
jgi:hypothetical protein